MMAAPKTKKTSKKTGKTFFPAIYGSWEDMQKEKFRMIFGKLGDNFIRSMKNKKILDIGAGAGYLGDFLAEKGIENIIALEPDRKMPGTKNSFIHGKAEDMPFKPATFDFAFIIDTIHLAKRIDASCLKKNGIVVVSLFCNDENIEEKREMMLEKINDFEMQTEFTTDTREKEIVIIARKK